MTARPHIFLVPLIEAWDETAQLRGVRLAAPAELSQRYRQPGQYLAVEDAGTRSYFALASAPEGPLLEILVRRGSVLADAVAALEPGPEALIPVRDVLGEGFPLAEQEGRDLLLVAAGSGIAPLRALLQVVLRRRDAFGQMALYYGQRRPADFAYAREFPVWEAAGVRVVPVASEGGVYVQDQLRAAPPPFLGPDTSAFLVGMRAMMDEAERVLLHHGVPRGRIFENH